MVSLVLLTSACSSTSLLDGPVFVSVGTPSPSSGECPDGNTCVDVPMVGLGSAVGQVGRCEIYTTPGDPEMMDPLASEGVEILAVDAGGASEVSFTWQVVIPAEIEPGALNPVCSPMIEG